MAMRVVHLFENHKISFDHDEYTNRTNISSEKFSAMRRPAMMSNPFNVMTENYRFRFYIGHKGILGTHGWIRIGSQANQRNNWSWCSLWNYRVISKLQNRINKIASERSSPNRLVLFPKCFTFIILYVAFVIRVRWEWSNSKWNEKRNIIGLNQSRLWEKKKH